MQKSRKIREKFLARDCDALSKSELVDFMVKRGVKEKNAKKLFEQISKEYNNKNFQYSQKKNRQNFYVCDGIQFSILDLLIDKKKEYNSQENKRAEKIKILDLFAGIGGIKIGFEKAGFECVFSNDFDKDCKITYDLNFSRDQKSLVLGDISKISSSIIPDFDILTGGFPCQPFSIAGYRKGFDDGGRGNLFFEIVRILKDKKPKAFLLENVKNLKTHDSGNTLKVIYSELRKLGYNVVDKVLNIFSNFYKSLILNYAKRNNFKLA